MSSVRYRYQDYNIKSWRLICVKNLQPMVSNRPRTLLDLCSIRIAYVLWIRQDVRGEIHDYKNFYMEHFLISTKVRNLKLPESCKSSILDYVEFSGRQLFSLLFVWTVKMKLRRSLVNSFKNMFYESLVLNSDGLINQRKTAENMIRKQMISYEFPLEFTFRLACINYLEFEIIKLWIHEDLQQYFLYPIVFEKEFDEVLFWIYFSFSEWKFRSSNILSNKDMHFVFHCIASAATTGNVAYFDYLKNFCREKIPYNNLKMAGYMLSLLNDFNEVQLIQPCIIFHLKLLNLQEKAVLFREHPHKMMGIYLNQPLSRTFVENAVEIWKFIPDQCKGCVFKMIFSCFYGESEEEMYENCFKPRISAVGNYSNEHLLEIWNCLWKISSDSHKLPVLESFVFRSLKKYALRKLLFSKFDTSALKGNLLKLFLSNGKAVFELYRGRNLKESLIRLISKYLPEDFKELNRRYFKETPKKKKIVYRKPYVLCILHCANPPGPDIVLKYIREVLPSNGD